MSPVQMLLVLTKRFRDWAAGILVATYAFGVVAPSMVFSFNGNASIIHSLTEVHGDLLMLHFHHDELDHKSSDKNAPAGDHHCCGVVALPGLLPPSEISFVDQICVSLVSIVPQDNDVACHPARLDRPPRHLPSI
jgi:hypothetical protein